MSADKLGEIVECRSDSTYAERPVAFTWQGLHLDVVEILARWRAPGTRGFRVRTPGGVAFELVYDENSDVWSIRESA